MRHVVLIKALPLRVQQGACLQVISNPIFTSVHPFTRGMPYVPEGSIQDFTSSSRHQKLAELQQEIDELAGRVPSKLFQGPTIQTKWGPEPLLDDYAERLQRRQQHGQNKGSQNYGDLLDPKAHLGRPRSVPGAAGSTVSASADGSERQSPFEGGSSYTMDVRVDPRYNTMPEHVRAAKQAVRGAQWDASGETIRGIVPPPPLLDPHAPREFIQPRVHLGSEWWILMCLFAVLAVLLVSFGK